MATGCRRGQEVNAQQDVAYILRMLCSVIMGIVTHDLLHIDTQQEGYILAMLFPMMVVLGTHGQPCKKIQILAKKNKNKKKCIEHEYLQCESGHSQVWGCISSSGETGV